MQIRPNKVSKDPVRSRAYPDLPEPKLKNVIMYLTSFGHEFWLPDYYYRRKNNDLFMINYVIKGKVSLTVNGVERIIDEGGISFINLMNPSELYPVEDDTEIYFFHFKGGNARDLYNALVDSSNGEFVFYGIDRNKMKGYFDGFVESANGGCDHFVNSALLYEMLMNVFAVSGKTKVEKYPDIVLKVLNYTYLVYPTPGAGEIADHFGYNRVYLERVFKKYLGETLGQYVAKKRYGQACQYLMETDLSVAEIASLIGYETPQGLITLFKRVGKTTPLAFKKAMRKSLF